MKHLFIINPAAGSCDQTVPLSAEIRAVCGPAGIPYEIAVSRAPGDCERIAREAAETGEEVRIYACGGDGTLNEVVRGVAGHKNAAVTCLPRGSGNDFIRIFSEPEAFRDLARLLDAQEAEFDLIRCNDTFALNVCSVGLDARIGTDIAKYKRVPVLRLLGAYNVSTVVNLLRGISRPFRVEINGEVIDARQTLICACNGRFYGGGYNPVPEADPADGLLDVLLVKKVNLFQVAGVIGEYKKGRYARYPQLIRHVRTDRFCVDCGENSAVNLDGELLTARRAEFSVAEEKLRFFYPRGLTWAAKTPEAISAT